MKLLRWLLGGALVMACATTTTKRLGLPPLETVEYVELSRYTGTWYEIAAFPQRFEKGCTGTTATYALRPDGDIDVTNRCRLGSLDGKEKVAHARAWVVDPRTNAKLKVRFFWPFAGDYWIIDLAEDYSWAVVGHPSRDYLWILARTPTMEEARLQQIVSRAGEKGYETSRLARTLQAPPAS